MKKKNFFKRRAAFLKSDSILEPKRSGSHLFSLSLDKNIQLLISKFGESSDFVYHRFNLNLHNTPAALIFLDSLVDTEIINNQIMRFILQLEDDPSLSKSKNIVDFIFMNLLQFTNIYKLNDTDNVIRALLYGDTVLFVEGQDLVLGIRTGQIKTRSISDPSIENEIKGPRESFIEDIHTNMAMVRRKIRNENLRFLNLQIGDITQTGVCIGYIHGIADAALVSEVKERLGRIQIDGVLDSAYIEELIQDHPYSPFSLVDYSERPDKTAAMLLEGRIVIFVDGTPLVLIVPVIFMQFFSTSGDYYLNFYFASFLRWIRLAAFFFALTVPSLYIALTTMHQEMIPTQLALRIAGSRSGIPFPALVEALLMEVSFEILREAGVRLPKGAGQAVSIVGALIIGQAAVEAGIVSPILIIVVSLTGISSFAIAKYEIGLTVRLLRFPLMIISSILGIPGITVAILALLVYMVSLKSFGVPYLSPLSPMTKSDLKDTLIRASWRKLAKSKHFFNKENEFDIEGE
ncbi:spore germination protein [Neobacillus sp. WH10]|uniref:spore germination protein n=1 Tax=Neobacillus sp. WH10 TaxID=3047873 RepID=UPI0024C17F34|nr:spore germination protein [Neobacillus sp. WH10]WHY75225.1 spore germination protein [Neobacillus sp. WH10]